MSWGIAHNDLYLCTQIAQPIQLSSNLLLTPRQPKSCLETGYFQSHGSQTHQCKHIYSQLMLYCITVMSWFPYAGTLMLAFLVLKQGLSGHGLPAPLAVGQGAPWKSGKMQKMQMGWPTVFFLISGIHSRGQRLAWEIYSIFPAASSSW